MASESNYYSQHLSGDKALGKVLDLLKHFRAAMITNDGGSPHSRGGDFWERRGGILRVDLIFRPPGT